jgi:pimeloyl-ACP methyl ester carboxylesterase
MNRIRLATIVLLSSCLVAVALPGDEKPAAQAAAPPSTFEPAELTAAGGTLYGTLLLPGGTGRVPAVLLIAGSGPTDRNGNSSALPGANDSLRLLAEGMADNGIASLRYDKRGIAQSARAVGSESDLRFDTYVDDAAAWCDRLRKDARFSAVLIAGHSEGSLIGMVAAKRCNAEGFISINGAGRPAADVLRTQLAGKLPADLAAQSEAVLRSLEQGKTTHEVPAQLNALYRPSVQPYLISWFRYDPVKAIAALDVPVLVIQGTTDVQVSADDAKRLAGANPKARLLLVEGMNHVLKDIPLDRQAQMESYNNPKLPLAAPVIPAIVDLVRGAVKK